MIEKGDITYPDFEVVLKPAQCRGREIGISTFTTQQGDNFGILHPIQFFPHLCLAFGDFAVCGSYDLIWGLAWTIAFLHTFPEP